MTPELLPGVLHKPVAFLFTQNCFHFSTIARNQPQLFRLGIRHHLNGCIDFLHGCAFILQPG